MTILRLQPEPIPAVTSTPSAWFIAGGDPTRWLRGLVGWRRSAPLLRLAIIPTSCTDPRPCGAFVLDAIPPADDPNAIPFVRRGKAFYLPQAARLWPPVDDAELEALFPGDLVVWHPGTGPVTFLTADLRSPSDLLAAPAVHADHWTRAHPGILPARLRAIVVPPLRDIDALIQSGRDDITSRDPSTLPTPTDEHGSVARAMRLVSWGLAKGIHRLAELAPGTAGQPTWINQIQEWAQRSMASNDPRLDDARHRELGRLLKTLTDDPDKGLRYALPLAGSDAHRGIANPGTQLTSRNLDFSTGGGGGRPIDPWTIDQRIQAELRARYLALAEREIALGRHRRAAYIHATLLGDLTSAAAALEKGRHFREAAAIHLDRLKRPVEAARILERGGLLDEAARLFSEHGEHLAAAECHRRLGRTDDAQRSWRKAVAILTEAKDALGAADLLATHLEAPEEALVLLAGAWPGHPQAGRCLTKRFDLLGRLGRHQETSDLVETLVEQEHGREDLALDALVHVVGTYPDRSTGSLAADAGRRLVGRHLAAGHHANHLLTRLHGLARGDRLLASDASRWSRRAATGQSKPRPAILLQRPAITFRLDGGVHWNTAVGTSLGLVVAGWVGSRLVVSSATWAGSVEFMHWQDLRQGDLNAFPLDGGRVYMRIRHPSGWAPLAVRNKAASDAWGETLHVGTFGPLHGTVAACAAAHDGGWWMLIDATDGWRLTHARSEGAAVHLPLPELPRSESALLCRIGRNAVVAVGTIIGIFGTERSLRTHDLGDRVTDLIAHPDPAVSCVVAITVGGISACWAGDDITTIPFAGALAIARVGFTADGLLVVASTDGALRAYTCVDRHVVHVAESRDGFTGTLISICAGPGTRSIILVTDKGVVTEWRIPESECVL